MTLIHALAYIALVLMLSLVILTLLVVLVAFGVMIWRAVQNAWDDWYDEQVQRSLRRR